MCVCGGKTYLSFTYFLGAVPENNYTPSQPFKLVINADHTSGAEPGYMKLMIPCGGADSPLIDTAEQEDGSVIIHVRKKYNAKADVSEYFE